MFVSKDMRFTHVGDVLFNGSVGSTDLPGGDHETLINSIKTKLLPLGDDVSFICGHGPDPPSDTNGRPTHLSSARDAGPIDSTTTTTRGRT